MKIKEAREAYYDHSGAASLVARQVAFAGIAIIWIFKTDSLNTLNLPEPLLYPALLIIVSLVLDLSQYVYSSAAWGIFHRRMENKYGVDYEGEVYAPAKINWPSNVFFLGKILALVIGYFLLIKYASLAIVFK
ncbi:MAG: hypothetical protein JAZ17_02445 [Candidatus Thiodiazotropha endolucinida]|nr:hypothetical protein [Candidatus Thiodiazotropha endolucinida]